MKTPKARTVKVVCDVCGLDWDAHTKKLLSNEEIPTLETCVELLKAELAKPRPFTNPSIPATPWPPSPQPIIPYRPYIPQPNTARPFDPRPYYGNLS